MNAGKSTSLLQSNHNYEVRDLKTYLFTPAVDAEVHDGKIHSRLGISKDAIVFDSAFNFIEYFLNKNDQKISCILIDEAQFLTELQVKQLCNICDEKNIPIMCYGIRTDFQGKVFVLGCVVGLSNMSCFTLPYHAHSSSYGLNYISRLSILIGKLVLLIF